MVMPLNDWVFLELKRLRDLAQELFEPLGSFEQALVLVGLVSGEIQQHGQC